MRKGQITRQLLLDSAIDLVAEVGYTNTTTQAVLDRSGVSRGSLLHQFGTRNELMVATGDAAIRRMLASIVQRMGQAADPVEGLFRFPAILWDVLTDPPALAFYEIQMASRWDKDLFEGLKEASFKAELGVERTVQTIAGNHGMSDFEGYLIDIGIISDALRGLVARRSLARDRKRVEAERQALEVWHSAALNARLPKRHRRAASR